MKSEGNRNISLDIFVMWCLKHSICWEILLGKCIILLRIIQNGHFDNYELLVSGTGKILKVKLANQLSLWPFLKPLLRLWVRLRLAWPRGCFDNNCACCATGLQTRGWSLKPNPKPVSKRANEWSKTHIHQKVWTENLSWLLNVPEDHKRVAFIRSSCLIDSLSPFSLRVVDMCCIDSHSTEVSDFLIQEGSRQMSPIWFSSSLSGYNKTNCCL